MAVSITIIDYGVGNLRSVTKAFEKLGCQVTLTDNPNMVAEAHRLVLPGVGAFGAGMEHLRIRGLIDAIIDAVNRGVPFLGICLGLQLLFSVSEELGMHEGLNIIRGRVVPFPQDGTLKVPHMGWNELHIRKREPLFTGLRDGVMTYFVHSFYVVPEDESVIASTTDYGVEFVSAVACDNILGTQFHPEKSSGVGLTILRNFVDSTL